MKRSMFLFFILLSLVVIRAYAEESLLSPPKAVPAIPSTTGLTGSDSDLSEMLPGEIQAMGPSEPTPIFSTIPGRKFLSIRLETYQPTGQGLFTDQSTSNLSNIGSTVLPTITYGALTDSSSLGEFQTTYGLEANASFATQDASFVSTSGLLGSGKFQTAVLSLKPLMRFHWRMKQKIFTRVSAELGYEQVNLYGSSNIGTVAHGSGFVGYGLGLEWDPFDRYGLIGEYYTRTGTASDQNGWTPTAASYQLGVLFFF